MLCPERRKRPRRARWPWAAAIERRGGDCLNVASESESGAPRVWSQRTLIVAADGSTGGPWKRLRKTRRRVSIGARRLAVRTRVRPTWAARAAKKPSRNGRHRHSLWGGSPPARTRARATARKRHVCARCGRGEAHGCDRGCRREAHGLMGGSLLRCQSRYLYRRPPRPPRPLLLAVRPRPHLHLPNRPTLILQKSQPRIIIPATLPEPNPTTPNLCILLPHTPLRSLYPRLRS